MSLLNILKKSQTKISAVIILFFVATSLPVSDVKAQSVSPQATFVSRNYVVKLKADDTSVLIPYANNIERKFEFSSNSQFRNVYSFSSPANLGFLRQQLSGKYDYLDLDQPVELKAESSLRLTSTAAVTTNDPGFTLNSIDIDRQWGLAKAGVPAAWLKTTGSINTVVAVIDTGVDATHEDLRQANFVAGLDIAKSQTIFPGTNSDDNGHGTVVTGIIAATPNNGIGIVGTAWRVSIMPIKALNSQGSGSSSDISEAIVWAADHGANIINISLGGLGFGHDTTLANSISYAYNKNVVLVAAAGNDVAVTGGNLDNNPVFPICDDNGENMILGVTATDTNDVKPDFANYGKGCIDVSAPGKRILSTINHDPATGNKASNSYAYASGTSVAVPFVVGQAALLKSLFPNATNKQIRDRIITSVDPIDDRNPTQCNGSCKGLLGAGRINVFASLDQQIVTTVIQQGDLVQVQETGIVYYINGGKRQSISPFVRNQRFPNVQVKQVSTADLAKFPEGGYAEPLDGTLVKSPNNPTVYFMSKGLRLPVTYQVFTMRGLNFGDVVSVVDNELNSWLVGSFLTPPEGILVKTAKNPTVYWVIGGVLHPINYAFYIDRGLNIFPVTVVSDNDLKNFSKGEAYVK